MNKLALPSHSVLDRVAILRLLKGYAIQGTSSTILRDFIENGEGSTLAMDNGLKVKLYNVLASVTVITLGKIVASSTLSTLSRALLELEKSGAIAPDTLDLVKALPVSKILESSDVWTLVQTGIFSEPLAALAAKGQAKKEGKAAGAKKRAATIAAKKGGHLKDVDAPSKEDVPKIDVPKIDVPKITEPKFDYVGYCQQVKSDCADIQKELADNQSYWESDIIPIFEACSSLSVKDDFDGLAMIKACALTLTNGELDQAISALIATRKGRETRLWDAA